MESPKRKRDWIPKVEQSFEWSRLESQLTALAYEQVLPPVQHWVACPRHSNQAGEMTNAKPRQAAGA